MPIEPVGAEIAARRDPTRSAAIQVGTCTPLVTEVDRPLGLGHVRPHRREHRARHLAVQLADRVGRAGRPDRQRRHVELRRRRRCRRRRAPGSDRGSAPSVPQQPARCFSTRWNGNASCPAGTGVCVVNIVVWRISSSASSNDRALLDQIADPLQHDEAGVAFVQVEDAGVDAERLQRADAADAEDDLLLDARLAIAAVEARRQLAIPRRVLFEIGVEQVQRHAAEPHAPDRDEHRCDRRAAPR